MKGMILQRTDAQLVDVAHDFPRQDVRSTAFWLRETLPYFPPAVHLVVVDPGVGTDRHAIAIRAGGHALVGPDNGVLVPVARHLADGNFDVFRIAEQDPEVATGDWPPVPATSTFHGRDVFAPAAAEVHEVGIESLPDPDGFAPTGEFVDLTFPEAAVEEASATGEVLVVDGFGNVITNIPGEPISSRFGEQIECDGETVRATRTYAAVPAGQRIVTVGSHGNVELAVNRGRGDEAFDLAAGDKVRLGW